jgi:hypothetical protein
MSYCISIGSYVITNGTKMSPVALLTNSPLFTIAEELFPWSIVYHYSRIFQNKCILRILFNSIRFNFLSIYIKRINFFPIAVKSLYMGISLIWALRGTTDRLLLEVKLSNKGTSHLWEWALFFSLCCIIKPLLGRKQTEKRTVLFLF